MTKKTPANDCSCCLRMEGELADHTIRRIRQARFESQAFLALTALLTLGSIAAVALYPHLGPKTIGGWIVPVTFAMIGVVQGLRISHLAWINGNRGNAVYVFRDGRNLTHVEGMEPAQLASAPRDPALLPAGPIVRLLGGRRCPDTVLSSNEVGRNLAKFLVVSPDHEQRGSFRVSNTQLKQSLTGLSLDVALDIVRTYDDLDEAMVFPNSHASERLRPLLEGGMLKETFLFGRAVMVTLLRDEALRSADTWKRTNDQTIAAWEASVKAADQREAELKQGINTLLARLVHVALFARAAKSPGRGRKLHQDVAVFNDMAKVLEYLESLVLGNARVEISGADKVIDASTATNRRLLADLGVTTEAKAA